MFQQPRESTISRTTVTSLQHQVAAHRREQVWQLRPILFLNSSKKKVTLLYAYAPARSLVLIFFTYPLKLYTFLKYLSLLLHSTYQTRFMLFNVSQGTLLPVLSDRETDIKSIYGQPKHIVSILPCQKHAKKPAGRAIPRITPSKIQI